MLSTIALVALGLVTAGQDAASAVDAAGQDVVQTRAATVKGGDDVPPAKAASSAVTVSIPTKDQLLLTASYWAPKGKGKAPGALLVHEAGADRRSLDELGEALHKKGFAVLAIDVRGHGESVSKDVDWAKAEDDKARELLWGLAARDLDAAAGFLVAKNEVQASLALFGVGAGGALALRQAKADSNARAVVLVTPEAKSYGYDMAQGVASLGGLPTLVVASAKGKDVAEALKKAGDDANQGQGGVEIALSKAEPAAVLGDSKQNNASVTWLRNQVMPTKK